MPRDVTAISTQGPDTFPGNPVSMVASPPLQGGNPQTPQNGGAHGANAAQTATLAATAGQRTCCAGVVVTGLGATAAIVATLTISPLQGGNLVIPVEVPAGVTVALTPMVITFNPPLVANALNTPITAVLSAFGAGNTDQGVNAWGFSQ